MSVSYTDFKPDGILEADTNHHFFDTGIAAWLPNGENSVPDVLGRNGNLTSVVNVPDSIGIHGRAADLQDNNGLQSSLGPFSPQKVTYAFLFFNDQVNGTAFRRVINGDNGIDYQWSQVAHTSVFVSHYSGGSLSIVQSNVPMPFGWNTVVHSADGNAATFWINGVKRTGSATRGIGSTKIALNREQDGGFEGSGRYPILLVDAKVWTDAQAEDFRQRPFAFLKPRQTFFGFGAAVVGGNEGAAMYHHLQNMGAY